MFRQHDAGVSYRVLGIAVNGLLWGFTDFVHSGVHSGWMMVVCNGVQTADGHRYLRDLPQLHRHFIDIGLEDINLYNFYY